MDSPGWRRLCIFGIACALISCNSADSDRTARRRDAARRACEGAILDQMGARATATFDADKEHVFYDSTGGAGVTGIVAAGTGTRNFACILKPATDTTWSITAAKLLN